MGGQAVKYIRENANLIFSAVIQSTVIIAAIDFFRDLGELAQGLRYSVAEAHRDKDGYDNEHDGYYEDLINPPLPQRVDFRDGNRYV